MRPSKKLNASESNGRLFSLQSKDFSVAHNPDTEQLENIKTHLDLLLIALESLTEIGSEEIIKAAKQLDLESVIADRVSLWRLRQSNPQRKSSGGRKKLDVEEARSLVSIVCYLARDSHQLIRHACSILERTIEQDLPLHRDRILGDYLDAFTNIYQERMRVSESTDPESLYNLAQKLLVDLLFYSNANGNRRLWLALLDYSE